MLTKHKQRGIAMPLIVSIIGLIIVIGAVAYFAASNRQQASSTKTSNTNASQDIVKEDGTIVKPDGTMVKTDGTMVKPDGAMIKPDGTMVKPENETNTNGTSNTNQTSSTNTSGDHMVKFTGTVLAGSTAPLLEYNKADFDAAVSSGKLVVLYFYANWCSICKAEFPKMEAVFDTLTGDQVVGFRVNYNDNDTESGETALAREYGVAYQHTKVFLKNGSRILKSPEAWETSRYTSEIAKALTQ